MDTEAWMRAATILAVLALVAACTDERSLPTAPEDDRGPTFVLESNGGCVPEVITTSGDSTETLLFTFTTSSSNCTIDGYQYGVDFGSPFPGSVDFTGTMVWLARDTVFFLEDPLNIPSPSHIAYSNGPPYQNFIEFDPPVRSVEFYYASRDGWGGAGGAGGADTIPVWVLDQDFYSLDKVILQTNNSSLPVSVWDLAQLSAPTDSITWLRIDALTYIDDLRITRGLDSIPDPPDPEPCDSIFDQPTGDSFLDSSEFQEGLYDALVESGAFQPDLEQRLETPGYLYERPDESLYWKHKTGLLTQTACGNTPGGPEPDDPNDVTVAAYHTHPFHHRDLMPQACPDKAGAEYNANIFGGPSSQDWWVVRQNNGIPTYVIDLDNVYKADLATAQAGTTDPAAYRTAARFAWNPLLCQP